jgi:hypothetical protein
MSTVRINGADLDVGLTRQCEHLFTVVGATASPARKRHKPRDKRGLGWVL